MLLLPLLHSRNQRKDAQLFGVDQKQEWSADSVQNLQAEVRTLQQTLQLVRDENNSLQMQLTERRNPMTQASRPEQQRRPGGTVTQHVLGQQNDSV